MKRYSDPSVTWDDGVCWYLEQVTAPDPADDPLTVAIVRDDHLRAANGSLEDDYIQRLMTASLRAAERGTWRDLLPTTNRLVLDRFPCWEIEFPRPPFQGITGITYIDVDGVEQSLTPANVEQRMPVGPQAAKGSIWPLYGEQWPGTRCQRDAVRITFESGYPLIGGSPGVADIPEDITTGRLLMIGELYKQRSESVHAFNQNPALIRAKDLWLGYRAY